jgi:hypothetical protein
MEEMLVAIAQDEKIEAMEERLKKLEELMLKK